METQSFSDDVRRYLALLWHWAWLLALTTILAGVVAYFVSDQMPRVYQATTTILVNEAPTTRYSDYSSILSSERLTQTYSQLIVKQPTLEGVLKRLGLEGVFSIAKLRSAITVEPVRDTQLIDIRVEDGDPDRAALIANALVIEFSDRTQQTQAARYTASKTSLGNQLDQLDENIKQTSESLIALNETGSDEAERTRLEALQAQYRQTYAYLLQSYEAVRLAEAQSTSSVSQAEPAIPNYIAVRPQVMTNTLLAAIVGLMMAVGLVFIIEALDDTLRSPDDVARQLGVPILGLIARFDYRGDNPVTAEQPRGPVSEAFRSLRTNIQFASVDNPLRTLLVTSPSPSDGKSTVATNLGVVLAQSDRRVVVLDADLRRPRIHKIMRLPNRRGVTELFVQPKVVLDGSLQKTETQNLFAVTSGSLPPNPSELLGSEKMGEILAEVRDQVDLIILDTPPVLAVTDAMVLAARVDGVLLVVKPGTTKLAAARQAVEQLRRSGANLLGVVLNDVRLNRSRYYYHYKSYYYAYYNSYTEPPTMPLGKSRTRKKQ